MGTLEFPDSQKEKSLDEYLEYIRQQDANLERIELALHRMRRLAEMASSDRADLVVDRTKLQKEIEVLKREIDQLADRGNHF